ncbi:MAG: hypothetical protein HMLKMBBP_01671 [Planctomycetes bacterium]|nr:hypothetical protein [Planctomycetota bacterium]
MSTKPSKPKSAGLVFRKLDLHVHSPGSADFDDKSVTPAAFVQACLAAGLQGVAVTDHNSAAWIDEVKKAAVGTTLTVFPGVEITCRGGKDGIHVIALLDPMHGRAEVESLLSVLGFETSQYGKLDTVASKEVMEVVAIIRDRGGVAILAHANSSRGVLRDMSGKQRTDLIRHPAVTALEAADFQDAARRAQHHRAVDYLDGTDAEYRRKLAVYQASDNPGAPGTHSLATIGSRCAFFKMDRIDIDSLKQCLADPDVRIRQDFELKTYSYPRIQSLRITGGFLDGESIVFHDGLNSILGAKGTGKSLIIEFLRFALDQAPSNADLANDHDAKLRARLELYGAVEVTLVDETGKPFTVKRTYDPAGGHPYDGGQTRDLARAFPVFFLSQNEILKIAEDRDSQLAFIDTFFDFRSYQFEIAERERELKNLDQSLAECMRASIEAKDVERQVVTVREEITKLDVSLKDPILSKFAAVAAKDLVLKQQLEAIRTIRQRVAEAKKSATTIGTPPVPEALQDDPAVRRALGYVAEVRFSVSGHFEALDGEIAEVEARAVDEYARWRPTFEEEKKAYDSAIQSRGGDSRVLAQKRAKLFAEFEGLERKLAAAKDRAGELPAIGQKRKATVEAHRKAYQNYTAERKTRCEKIAADTGGRLKVEIHEATNRAEFRARLTALKRGSYLKDHDIEKLCGGVDSGDFMRAIVSHALGTPGKYLEEVAQRAGIDGGRMRTLAEFLTETYTFEQLLALEYMGVPRDRPEISYNVVGKFEQLDRLSIGQKCTAMLLIALSDGTAPIVIDQPEDSLDLRSIWDDVCKRVRQGKDQRQFIFTTHNSSVAVATDTDMFTILEADATRGRIVYSGSMDHEPLSKEALQYLEGGTPTYKLKFSKYRAEEFMSGDAD